MAESRHNHKGLIIYLLVQPNFSIWVKFLILDLALLYLICYLTTFLLLIQLLSCVLYGRIISWEYFFSPAKLISNIRCLFFSIFPRILTLTPTEFHIYFSPSWNDTPALSVSFFLWHFSNWNVYFIGSFGVVLIYHQKTHKLWCLLRSQLCT